MTHPLPDALRAHCADVQQKIKDARLRAMALLGEAGLIESQLQSQIVLYATTAGLPTDGRTWYLLPDSTAITDRQEGGEK